MCQVKPLLQSKAFLALQVGMNIITTALISLDLSWVQDLIRQNESTGYSSLTRALLLASQAGRMTRLLRVMNLVGLFRVRATEHCLSKPGTWGPPTQTLQRWCALSGSTPTMLNCLCVQEPTSSSSRRRTQCFPHRTNVIMP